MQKQLSLKFLTMKIAIALSLSAPTGCGDFRHTAYRDSVVHEEAALSNFPRVTLTAPPVAGFV